MVRFVYCCSPTRHPECGLPFDFGGTMSDKTARENKTAEKKLVLSKKTVKNLRINTGIKTGLGPLEAKPTCCNCTRTLQACC